MISAALSSVSIDQLPVLARVAVTLAVFLVIPALSRRIGLPGSAGLILCGILFGKSGFDLVRKESSALPAMAEVGKLLILFYAGLEIDLGASSSPASFRARSPALSPGILCRRLHPPETSRRR